MRIATRFLVPVLLLAPSLGAQASRNAPESLSCWPQFRGAFARGLAERASVPSSWDVKSRRNVAWMTRVPGLAHSSPVVWSGRVFVTTAVRRKGEEALSSLYGSPGYGAGESAANDSPQAFQLLCLDLRTGKLVWEVTAREGVPRTKRHPKSSHANPTPACDAGHVVACFGSEGLYCYDHAGKLLWKKDLGLLNSGAPGYKDKTRYQWGFASSPVIYGSRVLVQCDHEGESFVTALDLDTGRELWRTPRQENSTWCTPTVHDTSATGSAQVILGGYKHIGGYDLATGKELWKLVGGGDVPVPTPVVARDLVFLTSAHGRDRPVRAVRIDARGTLKREPGGDSALVWEHRRRGVYMQTPLVLGGLLYLCSDGGILACYDARTGSNHYRARIGGGRTGFSASAVAAGGRLYYAAESGEVFVVRPGKVFKLLAENDLGETCMATPAVADDTLLFRTRHHLVAIR